MRWTQRTIFTAIAVFLGTAAPHLFAQSLDFEAYKSRVEPIFLKKRPGHARCVVCHEANNSGFRLLPRPQTGSWTEEQSRMNFENVRNLVKAGDPEDSRLLIHPLAEKGGGDKFHSGGRQFMSKSDPEWQTLAKWVRGAK